MSQVELVRGGGTRGTLGSLNSKHSITATDKDTKLPIKSPAGINITYQDLTYTVEAKDGPLDILKNLTGHFKPGKLTALMGPSGSGKTTLLDLLSGRKNVGETKGKILFDGRKPGPVVYSKLISYVEQFDTLVPDLTVREFLLYTAALKLPSSRTDEQRERLVDDIISKLSLTVCKDTIIGNELKKGISGGQSKRTNIAMALLTRPRIVFLDEPTTGLDSHMANEVVVLLKTLAQEGHTVIATIHSPTVFAFNQFDELTLLKAGEMIYHGEVGDQGSSIVKYFKTMGYAPDPTESVVEWVVELISGRRLERQQMLKRLNNVSEEIKDEKKADTSTDFAAHYTQSVAKKVAEQVEKTVAELKEGPDTFNANDRVVSNSMFHQMYQIFRYRTAAHYKNGEYIGPRLGDKILFSLLILSLYWGFGDSTDIQDMQSVASMLYFVVAILGYGAASFVPALTLDRPLFYRERSDGLYTTTTYFLAKFLEEAFIAIFTSLVFSITIFFALDLQGNFGIFLIVYYLTAMTGIVLAYFIAAAVASLDAANALLPTYVTINMFFGGLIIVFEKIPPGWQWFSWLCFLRYPWTALMLNQFDSDKFNENKVFADQSILDFYGMSSGFNNSIGLNILVLTGFMFFFAIIGCLALAYIRHDSR
mmetsp:Transcript_9075/g.13614  ORF Transcript_9075/g.13614 Transcript_9075/m.13614 type:complete len:649 (+) Transcript_9075:58-2004(+)